ncbi:MAG: class I SAM-dependent methyltransferase [Acidobacteria bacterium]|nr:class I SAM-dependent methyltransferase [Acidobacteriota bacterium]
MELQIDISPNGRRQSQRHPARPSVCPICEARELQVLFEEAYDYITGEVFQVWHCHKCEVGFTSPQPQNLEPYYPPEYRRYTGPVPALLKSLYRHRARGWSRMAQKPGRALELGCGDGVMLETLRQAGWSVFGMERTPAMAKVAHQTLELPIFVGGLEALLPEARFDLIIAFQALEHMRDPLAILKQCAILLKSGGMLIVSVPNLDSWQARYAGCHWFHLDVPRHLYHFSPRSLSKLLSLAGLTACKVNFVSYEQDPYGWVESILNRMIRRRASRHNLLTRALMRLNGFTPRNLLILLLGSFMFVPSLVLSLASWVCKKGALVQVTSVPQVTKDH